MRYLAATLALLAVVTFSASVYSVHEWEQVIITEFGKPVGEPVTAPGLHFKRPLIDTVHRYDKRLLRWDGERHRTITKDRKTILIDVTARWRIADPKAFLTSVQTVSRAHRRLDGIMESAVKNEIAKFDLFEIVRSTNRIHLSSKAAADAALIEEQAADQTPEVEISRFLAKPVPPLPQDEAEAYLAGRPVVLGKIISNARKVLDSEGSKLGIEIEDVLIKAFNYTDEVEEQVFLQMNEELKKIATRFRSQGTRRAEERRGTMLRDIEILSSEAAREAEQIRGRADAMATEIYAEAYSKDPDFYTFFRTLEAQREVLGANHTLVISTDSPLYQLLSEARPRR